MKPQDDGCTGFFPSPAKNDKNCPFLADFKIDLINSAELVDFLIRNSSANKTGQIFHENNKNDKNNNQDSSCSSIFILDCRSTFDFENLHIKNSINIIVPSILYKRLVKGTLSTPSLISSDQAREAFSRAYKTALVVLIPENNDGNGNHTNFGDKTNTNIDDSVSLLLYKKLREEGCDAKFIDGGLNAFSSQYPDLCQSSYSAVPFIQSSIAENNNGSSQSADKRKLSSERPSSLYYLDMKSLKLDDCGSSSDETASTSGFSSSSCATSCSVESCYYGNGSCGADESLLAPVSSLSEFGDFFGQDDPNGPQLGGQRFNQFQQNPNQNRQQGAKFPVEIIPHLFLGNSTNSTDREILRQYNIKYILNVTPDLPNVFENDELFHYLQIPIYDHWSQDLMVHFPTAINFIDEARHQHCGVLVHCLAGISRSVTVTVAYLMRTLSLSLEDAYDLVKNHKPNIAPNLNFMGQLLDFQRDLYGENPPSTGQSTNTNGPFSDSSLHPMDGPFESRDPFGQQEQPLPFPPAPLSAPPQRRETRRTKQLAECF